MCKFSFMEEWKEYKLGDVVNVLDYKRVPLSSKERSLHQGIYPYYGAQGIIDYVDDYIFDGTYLLIAEDGENLKSKIQNIAQLATGKYWVNNHAHIAESNGKSDIRFICYLLNIMDVSGYITGSAQPKLNQANLLSISIKLPSLQIQKSIANFLSVFDNKIECNRRINDNFTLSFLLLTCFVLWLLKLRNDNLQYQAQALYKSWFVDYEPFKDGELVESELGMRPKGGRVGKLREILEIKYGKDHKRLSDGIIPVYGSGGLMRYAEKPLYEGESVLIPRKGTLNNVMYVNEAFWTVDTMFYTIPKTQNSILFAYILLSNKDLASMNSGSAVPSMTTEILNNIQFVMPVSDVLAEFNPLVSTYYAQIKHYDQESRRLAQLRDTLLPRLMSGELEVNKVNCLS